MYAGNNFVAEHSRCVEVFMFINSLKLITPVYMFINSLILIIPCDIQLSGCSIYYMNVRNGPNSGISTGG
jgi:uncharacterized membrane protein